MSCESPLEEKFLRMADKFISPDIDIQTQVEFKTICGLFRVDFVLSSSDIRVGIECDGEDYHKNRKHLDEWRDAAILGDDYLDYVIRIPGKALYYNAHACFYAISVWYPCFFSERSRTVLKNAVSKYEDQITTFDEMHAFISFYNEDGSRIPDFCTLNRYFRMPPTGKVEFLSSLYEFAVKCGGGKPEELARLWFHHDDK